MRTLLFLPMLQPEKPCSHGLGKIKSATVNFTCLVLRLPSKALHRRFALLQLSPFLPVLISSSLILEMDVHLWKARPSTTQIQVQMQMSHVNPQSQVPLPELVVLSMVWLHLVLRQAHHRPLQEVQAMKAPVLQ